VTVILPTAAPHRLAPAIRKLGVAGLVGSVLLTVLGLWIVGDLYGRLRQSLDVTADAVRTVDATLDVAAGSLTALGGAVETVRAATEQAAASSVLVEQSVAEAASVIGEDLPEAVDAMRETMPALIEASGVIDTTLRGLALFGVPYSPDMPLGEGFRRLDEELAPLSETLKENGEVIESLVPTVTGFREQTALLGAQVDQIGAAVTEAAEMISDYQDRAAEFDAAIASTRDSITRGSWLMRALVLVAGAVGAAISYGLHLTGRALGSPDPVS
jgi:methyl-accepting chemotaxis protein